MFLSSKNMWQTETQPAPADESTRHHVPHHTSAVENAASHDDLNSVSALARQGPAETCVEYPSISFSPRKGPYMAINGGIPQPCPVMIMNMVTNQLWVHRFRTNLYSNMFMYIDVV